MPLYEYECQQCRRHTEKRQKFSDPEITDCPHCGGKLARVISAPNFAFAGGGWYKDLYASAKPPASGSEAAAASPGENKSGESKAGEAKPAGSSEVASAPPSTPAPAASASTASSTDKK